MTTLAAALVRQRALPLETVEQAMLRQSLFGGDLSTNLLELGSIDEQALLNATAAALDAPALPNGRITTRATELVRSLPAAQLFEHPLLPLSTSSNEILVAVAAPLPPSLVDELESRTGKSVALRAALEIRIRQAVADELGQPLDERTSKLLARLDGAPPIKAIETSGPPSSSGVPTPRVSLPAAAIRSLMPKRQAPKPQQPRRLGPFTAAMAEIELASAQTPGDVISVWLDFAAQYFEYTAVFAVQGDLAAGKAARGDGTVGEAFSRIGVPLDLPSVLQRARAASTWQLTSLEPRGLDRTLARDLGRNAGRQVLVLPISVRQRVVLITYGDHGKEDVLLDRVGDVLALQPLVERHLERLLVERKRGGKTSFQPPVTRGAEQSLPRSAELPDARERAAALTVALHEPPSPVDAAEKAADVDVPLESVPSQPRVPRVEDPHEGRTVPAPAAPAEASPATPDVGASRALSNQELDAIDDSWDLIQPVLSIGEGEPAPPRAHPNPSRTKTRDSSPPGSVWPGASTRPGIAAPRLELVAEPDSEQSSETESPRSHTPMLPPADVWEAPHGNTDAAQSEPTSPVDAGTARKVRIEADTGSSEALGAEDGEVLRRACLDLMERFRFGERGALDSLLSMGDAAAAVLVSELPGPIATPSRIPRMDPSTKASDLSPLLKAIVAFGPMARPHVIARTSDNDPKVRVWAIRLLGELPGRQAAIAVAQRIITDRDAEVRRAAYLASTQLLKEQDSAPALRQALLATAADRKAVITQRLAAIDAIADLRDAPAIPNLIELLADPNPGTAAAAQQALTVLARQDFGYDAKTWKTWWNNNKDRDRIEWVIDALDHRTPAIRQAASEELRLISRLYVGNFDDDSLEARAKVQKKYREWWASGARSPSGRPTR